MRWMCLLVLSAALVFPGYVYGDKDIPLLAEVPDFGVRVRVVEAGGKPAEAAELFRLTLAVGGRSSPFRGGKWSPWVDSTREGIAKALGQYPNSYNSLWQVKSSCTVKLERGDFRALGLEVETRIVGVETNRTPAQLFGPRLGILLWRDGSGVARVDTLTGHGRRVYDRAMRDAVLPTDERPRQIMFGGRYIGGDDDTLCWQEGIRRLCGLGFNAFHSVPAQFISLVRQEGIGMLWGAVYNPPGYAFNFAENRHDVFRKFANDQISGALAAGWQRYEIAFWVTSDEPGWYYPATYERFNANPDAMVAFHEYLKERDMRPRDFGKEEWQDVRLIGRKEYDDLLSKKLFYWSNRFIPWASSRFFAEVAEAYEGALSNNIPVMVNFNNFLGRLYQPGPVGNNNRKTDPNAAMGQHDWLEFGRLRGSTCIATEDWFPDVSADQWSFYAARLRSAADLGDVGFGALVIPRVSGQRPEGMAQKLLSLVGQGAKTIKFFTFGPEYNFPGNCYSENLSVFKPLSLGMQLVARAEDLLYPGQPHIPEVAIVTPQSSQFWDMIDQNVVQGLLDVTNPDMIHRHMAYMSEMYGLYTALQHAGIPVHFIDEQACTERALKRFKVIYLTAPDFPEKSAKGLKRWVRRGGTLVMTAGAALADRYHEPMTVLTRACGVKVTDADRSLTGKYLGPHQVGTAMFDDGSAKAYGDREKLSVNKAKVLARFKDGAPAVVERKSRRGRFVRFACQPGLSYRMSTTGTVGGLPAGFSRQWREWIVSPVIDSDVMRTVICDRPLIEVQTLHSDDGMAITLHNWSGRAQKDVRLTVLVDSRPTRIVSARRGELVTGIADAGSDAAGIRMVFFLDLADVDIVSVYY